MATHLIARCALVGLAAVVAEPARAGEVYGSLSEGGLPRAGVAVTLSCPGRGSDTRSTDGFGAFRLFVNAGGTCSVAVAGAEPAQVHLTPSPQRYNLELVRVGPRSVLRRR
jgi:hypothetical protein